MKYCTPESRNTQGSLGPSHSPEIQASGQGGDQEKPRDRNCGRVAKTARAEAAEHGAGKEASGDLDILTLDLQEDIPPKLRQSAQRQYPRKRDNQHKAEACWNVTNLEGKTQSTLLPGNFAAAGTRLSSFPGLQRPQQGKTDRVWPATQGHKQNSGSRLARCPPETHSMRVKSATGSEEKRTKLENTATLQQNQQTAIQSEKILEGKEKSIRGSEQPTSRRRSQETKSDMQKKKDPGIKDLSTKEVVASGTGPWRLQCFQKIADG